MIQYPSNFDPSKKYPALLSIYGGPASAATRETWTPPTAMAEYGFLVLTLDSRAAPGMGKRTLDDLYMKLGQTEMNDFAEGLKEPVSYTHLRAHETVLDLVCRLLLEKKTQTS